MAFWVLVGPSPIGHYSPVETFASWHLAYWVFACLAFTWWAFTLDIFPIQAFTKWTSRLFGYLPGHLAYLDSRLVDIYLKHLTYLIFIGHLGFSCQFHLGYEDFRSLEDPVIVLSWLFVMKSFIFLVIVLSWLFPNEVLYISVAN